MIMIIFHTSMIIIQSPGFKVEVGPHLIIKLKPLHLRCRTALSYNHYHHHRYHYHCTQLSSKLLLSSPAGNHYLRFSAFMPFCIVFSSFYRVTQVLPITLKCPMSNLKCQMSIVECRMSNVECQMSNVKCRRSNEKHQMKIVINTPTKVEPY